MRDLSFIPAFGFQTDTVNSDRIYRNENVKMVKKEMWEEFGNFEKRFPGAEIASTLAPRVDILVSQHMGECSEKYEKVVSSMRKASNLQKVLGYLPLIGTIVGISRLRSVHQDKQRGTQNLIKAHHLVRGSIELLSLGFLLLIPDLILTACRERRAAQQLDAKQI
jgi:hypothetical protein